MCSITNTILFGCKVLLVTCFSSNKSMFSACSMRLGGCNRDVTIWLWTWSSVALLDEKLIEAVHVWYITTAFSIAPYSSDVRDAPSCTCPNILSVPSRTVVTSSVVVVVWVSALWFFFGCCHDSVNVFLTWSVSGLVNFNGVPWLRNLSDNFSVSMKLIMSLATLSAAQRLRPAPSAGVCSAAGRLLPRTSYRRTDSLGSGSSVVVV